MLGARVVEVFGGTVAVVLVPAVVEVCCRVVVAVLARAVVEVAGDVAHAETAVALRVEDVGAEVVEPEAGAGTLAADRTGLRLDLHAPTTLTAAMKATSRASRRTQPILSPPAHQSSSDSGSGVIGASTSFRFEQRHHDHTSNPTGTAERCGPSGIWLAAAAGLAPNGRSDRPSSARPGAITRRCRRAAWSRR